MKKYLVHIFLKKHEIIEQTVSKVGNTYFEIENSHRNTKFLISNLKHGESNWSNRDRQLYQTEKEILDMWEKNELYQKVKEYFVHHRPEFTVEKLKEVIKILNI